MPQLVACVFAASVSFFALPELAASSTFLGYQAPAAPQRRSDLLDELEQVMGGDRRLAAESRVQHFEDSMRSIFRSLPKTEGDRLAPSGVRYLLHRVFVERHGWFVEGLMSRGESWNSSSPAAFFAEHVGDDIEGLFERRLGHHGLSLHEVAVFAATLESLVHEETRDRLHAAFRVLGFDQAREASPTEHETESVIDTYMMMLVLGLNHSTVSPSLVSRTQASIDTIYPTWHETKKWVREVRKEVVGAAPEARTSFATTTQVLDEVADRYGRWQDSECIALKEDLMKHEQGASGRVLLRDFYAAALDGSFQYKESKEYLRQHGILDESQPSQPSVIISNYINGPSNCLASSKFYSVCCISECEALFKPLEQHIAAPDSTPAQILELVERLPSATVEAPRTLPASLVRRLEEIAEHHGGRVPIHGRLFAQWMHHAYPRECTFPTAPGTAQPAMRRQLLDSHALLAEVRGFEEAAASGASGTSALLGQPELPWIAEEELVVPLATQRVPGHGRGSVLRHWAALGAVVSMTVATLRAAIAGRGPAGAFKKTEKCMV